MSGLQFIANLVKTGTVRTSDGKSLPLHSETSLKQCEFIQQQIREIHAKTTLEIGLAYGLSAIAICDAVGGMPGAMHHVIDPYPDKDSWRMGRDQCCRVRLENAGGLGNGPSCDADRV